MALHNLACETSLTTGTSDAVLAVAVAGCNTFALAGVVNGESVNYAITTYDLITHRPTHREVGTGTYTTATKTVARTTVVSSTNAGAKIVMTGLSDVAILPQASEIGGGGGGISFALYSNTDSTIDSIVDTGSAYPMTLTTEVLDTDNLFTLAANELTVATAGIYYITAGLHITTATAFGNGIIYFYYDSNAWNAPPPHWGPLLSVQTTSTSNQGSLDFTVAGSVELDAGATLFFGMDNFSGVTILVGITNIRIDKLS